VEGHKKSGLWVSVVFQEREIGVGSFFLTVTHFGGVDIGIRQATRRSTGSCEASRAFAMTIHTYRIRGQILYSQSDHGLAHLRVEVWDFGPFLFDEIASTATDDDGRFEVEFTQPHYSGRFSLSIF